MKTLHKIFLINIGIMLCYNAMIWSTADSYISNHWQLGASILLAIIIGVHILFAFMIGTYHVDERNRETAKAWFLSMLVILLIGCSFCLGGGALLG